MSGVDRRGSISWTSLPEHILVEIFSFLPNIDRGRAAITCTAWHQIFKSPYLWCHFNFSFYNSKQKHSLKCAEQHGSYIKSVCIELNQAEVENRENACELIRLLALQQERRLKHLRIQFTGENPCFYAGAEFIDALLTLFKKPSPDINMIHTLLDLDLSGLTISYTDDVINQLSENHPNLHKLNVQNRALVCRVTQNCMTRLVQRCRKLHDLRIFKCSASDDLLLALTEDDRDPLEHLSLACRREEKYMKPLTGDTWQAVTKKLPKLRVTLYFDHTCPLIKLSEVMKSEVPVSILRLETFTYIYDEVRLATAYYKDTLEMLVLETPLSRNSPELNAALLELSDACHNLKAMHVYCVLERDSIDKILAAHPEMKSNKTYTLKDS